MPIWEYWESKVDFQMDKLDPTESWYYTNFVLGCFAKTDLAEFYVPVDSVFSMTLTRVLRCPTEPHLRHNRFLFAGLDVWETEYFWDDERQYPVVGLDPVQYRSRLVTVLNS